MTLWSLWIVLEPNQSLRATSNTVASLTLGFSSDNRSFLDDSIELCVFSFPICWHYQSPSNARINVSCSNGYIWYHVASCFHFSLVFLAFSFRADFFMFARCLRTKGRWRKADSNTIHSLKSIRDAPTPSILFSRCLYRHHKLKLLINVLAEVLKIKTLFATANNNRWIENKNWIRIEKRK